jgi:long-subunit acyl-CoA synthetase (AMP-forming)
MCGARPSRRRAEDHQPSPEGEGEIQARTPTAHRGYLGDPVGVTDEDGWITTGDLGRIDDEGWLYVTGRLKDIVIRAVRTSPAPGWSTRC